MVMKTVISLLRGEATPSAFGPSPIRRTRLGEGMSFAEVGSPYGDNIPERYRDNKTLDSEMRDFQV
jgi:hypothetical protein